jgi:hypothetical protein
LIKAKDVFEAEVLGNIPDFSNEFSSIHVCILGCANNSYI